MESLHCGAPQDIARYNTTELRAHFLLSNLFPSDQVRMVYCYEDRMIVGGCSPAATPLQIGDGSDIGTPYLLSAREMGVANIGGAGKITVDGEVFVLANREVLYIGRGAQNIEFASDDPAQPARFYLNSVQAGVSHPHRLIRRDEAKPLHLGETRRSNVRNLAMYIHPEVAPSCLLMMGITEVEPGSAWNTMPPHLHERRMEAYLYLDIAPDDRVIHLMGRPEETRHLVVANQEVVISPSWSIHMGAGSGPYAFIWGMTGENQQYTDVSPLSMADLL